MRPPGGVLVAAIVVVFACAGIVLPRSAHAQDGRITIAAAKKATPKKKAPAAPSTNGSYTSMPLAERVGIQFDLAWTTYYNGLIDGEFTEKSVVAVRAFQKDRKFKETGVL